MIPGMLERHIQTTFTEYLQLDGWRALRTDPTSDKMRGKGFGERGMADHLYIRYCDDSRHLQEPAEAHYRASAEVLWIEFKRKDGRGRTTKPSQAQLDWHAAERAAGALTVIMGVDCPATIEGLVAWYEQSGLRRNTLTLGAVLPAAKWRRAR